MIVEDTGNARMQQDVGVALHACTGPRHIWWFCRVLISLQGSEHAPHAGDFQGKASDSGWTLHDRQGYKLSVVARVPAQQHMQPGPGTPVS